MSDPGAELVRFRDWHRAAGKRRKDYRAAFRNWLRKARAMNHERTGREPTGSDPPAMPSQEGVLRSRWLVMRDHPGGERHLRQYFEPWEIERMRALDHVEGADDKASDGEGVAAG